MHPSPTYPITYRCGHTDVYASIYEGDKLDQVLSQVAQQQCPPCNRAMHYQAPAGATDAELYAAKYEREEHLTGHAAHKKLRSVERLMANCQECGIARIKWMAAQPESSHIGRNGRRLAQIYKIGATQ